MAFIRTVSAEVKGIGTRTGVCPGCGATILLDGQERCPCCGRLVAEVVEEPIAFVKEGIES